MGRKSHCTASGHPPRLCCFSHKIDGGIARRLGHRAGISHSLKVIAPVHAVNSWSRIESAYRDYAAKIRQEYAWVPEPQYRDGRRRVLESFLSRPRIYHHLGHLEASARRNVATEIGRLGHPTTNDNG
jgi:hypothetical protein